MVYEYGKHGTTTVLFVREMYEKSKQILILK